MHIKCICASPNPGEIELKPLAQFAVFASFEQMGKHFCIVFFIVGALFCNVQNMQQVFCICLMFLAAVIFGGVIGELQV
jgi:hypothetical protein